MKVNVAVSAFLGLFLVLSIIISETEGLNATVTQKVFLNITINDRFAGRIVIGLFGKITPITVKNFATLAAGTMGYGYKGSDFHRVIQDFVVQGGDFVNRDGTGFKSIYNNGSIFDDENFNVTHFPGCVNMANKGPNTNGCQFSIILTKADWLNGKHTVFGKVLEGMDLVHIIEHLPTNVNDHPISTPLIAACGVIDVPVPFDVTTE